MSTARQELRTSFQSENWQNPEYRRRLVEQQNWEERGRAFNPELGAGVVMYGVGKRITNEQLPAMLDSHFNQLSQASGDEVYYSGQPLNTGFDESYWTDPLPKSKDEFVALQLGSIERIAQEAVESARLGCEESGNSFDWGEVHDLDVVGIAITAPADAQHLEEQVRKVLKLKDTAQVIPVLAACNSAAKAFKEIITSSPPGQKCLVATVETMMGFRLPMKGDSNWKGVSDEASMSFFSDSVTAFAFVSGTFEYAGGASHEMIDEKANLAAVNTGGLYGEPVVDEEGNESNVIYKKGNTLTVKMHTLEQLKGSMMRMNPRRTAYMFLNFFKNMYEKFQETEIAQEMEAQGNNYDVILSHRPSELLYERMAEILDKQGNKMKWSREMGNSPCSIFNFEMKDKLMQLRDGGNALFAFFGAGATGQIYSARVKSLDRVMCELESNR